MPRMAGHNTFLSWLNFKSVTRNCMTCIWPACIRIRLLLALMWDRNSSVRWDVRFEDGNNQWGWRSPCWLESQYLHKVFPFSCSKPHLLLGVAMPALAANSGPTFLKSHLQDRNSHLRNLRSSSIAKTACLTRRSTAILALRTQISTREVKVLGSYLDSRNYDHIKAPCWFFATFFWFSCVVSCKTELL